MSIGKGCVPPGGIALPDGTPWSEQKLEAKVNPELGRSRNALRCRLAELAARQIADRLRQVHAVKDIENVRAELEAESFKGNCFRELSVHIR